MPNYGDASYWEDRYKEQKNSTFDWLEDYSSLKSIIDSLNFDREKSQILILGCGNAEFSEDMYKDGFENIFNIDISSICIEQMKERNKNTKMLYEVMDVRDLQYPSNKFDLAIDKSTIDALLCGENSFVNVAKMMKEAQRTLKEGGIYMAISYGQPENRVQHLTRAHLHFELNIYTVKKNSEEYEEVDEKYEKVHYIYICKKKPGADLISEEQFEKVLHELEIEDKISSDYYQNAWKYVDNQEEYYPGEEEEEFNNLYQKLNENEKENDSNNLHLKSFSNLNLNEKLPQYNFEKNEKVLNS
jgi:ubiquinone/menaquinone biosynthesis C-methylase UbiE